MRGAQNDVLDMYPFYATDNVTVFGTDNERPFISLNLKGTSPWAPWHPVHNVAALSPDGRSLALISDGVLEVFAIPSRSTETP